LYRRRGEINLDKISAGTEANTPKPSMYIIGVNCAIVPAGKA
jgi:hypothetical protein